MNELSDEEWQLIGQHDVIGLNYFVHQRWVNTNFHYVRELEQSSRTEFSRQATLASASRFAGLVNDNPRYDDTLFFVQNDFFAATSKALLGWSLLGKERAVCLYRGLRASDATSAPPSRLEQGLPRQAGAIGAGVSLGSIFGWKRIVLIGVDLYDARYFWLPPQTVRNRALSHSGQQHPTAGRGVVELMTRWQASLAERNIRLEVYNPRSLLRPALEQYGWPCGQPVHAKLAR